MARTTSRLKDTQINASKNQDKVYNLYDGDGLILEIRPLPSKKKIWRYKYKSLKTGKDVLLTIGEYPFIKLAKAREEHSKYKTMLAEGVDPREHLQLEKIKKENAHSFKNVAIAWHKEAFSNGMFGADTAHKTMRKFEMHLFPLIGEIPIEEIETKDLKDAIKAINEKGINRVARDIRANLTRIFTYAISENYVKHNPARELKGVIKAKTKEHHPKLKYERLPEFFKKVDEYNRGTPLTKLCMLLTLHVFIRSSEIRFARWSEIDFDKQEWLIPPKREAVEGARFSDRGAKMKEEHLVPLSPQAISILKEIQEYSGHCENVFPGRDDPKKFISENTVNKALQNMGYKTRVDVCGHGFRGMACAALVQSRLYSVDAVERQMSHKERNAIREAYIHMAEFVEERKSMMNWWSNYLDQNRISYISPHDYGQQIMQQSSSNNKNHVVSEFPVSPWFQK